jgi:hypothetical protein
LTVASVAVLFAAACGGGSDAADADNNDGVTGGFAAYTECLKENGVTVTMPSGGPGGRPPGGAGPSGMPQPSGMPRPSDGVRPPGGGGFGKPAGVDDATWEKAQSACASVRPSGPGGGRPSGGPGRGADSAYRNCLRENGASAATSPDPVAAKACEVLKPSS